MRFEVRRKEVVVRRRMEAQQDLAAIVASSGYVEQLFDRMPDVVFFVKDLEGRYRVVNTTLVERCGAGTKADLIGRTASEVFPAPLGERYLEQDRVVVDRPPPSTRSSSSTSIPTTSRVGVSPTRSRSSTTTVRSAASPGSREIFRRRTGPVTARRSRQRPWSSSGPTYLDPPSVDEIAAQVGLSAYQLNRRLKDLLGITARQLLIKTRIDVASRLLRTTTLPIGDIAQQSGYCDQSAFTRQFRRTTGLTPRQYRNRHLGD